MAHTVPAETPRPQQFDTGWLMSWSASLIVAFIVAVSLGVIFTLERSIVAIGLIAISALLKATIDLLIRP
ncbi:MAG: hypothetical protein ACRBI6_02875 [Acidimicrobiales bacterium]